MKVITLSYTSSSDRPFPDSGSRIPDSGAPLPCAGDRSRDPNADDRPLQIGSKDEAWAAGVSLLEQAGIAKAQCRSFLAGLIKQHGEAAVVDAVRAAVLASPVDPRSYLKAACKGVQARRKPRPSTHSFEDIDYTEVTPS